LEDIIKGMTQGQGQQMPQQPGQQYPQQGSTPGQPSGDISIQDLEREMGIGTGGSGNTYQQQYPQQTGYPQQQQPSGSGIPGMEDYLPTNQPNTPSGSATTARLFGWQPARVFGQSMEDAGHRSPACLPVPPQELKWPKLNFGPHDLKK